MNTKLLLTKISYVILSTVGLDTQQTDWRIRHPQSVTQIGQIRPPFSPIRAAQAGILSTYCIWGHGSGAKENAPTVPSYLGHCLAATRSALSNLSDKAHKMLYTFLIAQRGQRLAQVRTRTISAIAQNETKAREQLQGLPLVFVRCTPTKGAAV